MPHRFLASCLSVALFTCAPAVRAENVKIAIGQFVVVDGDVSGNLAKLESQVAAAAAEGAKIVVFPELVDVGFGAIVGAPTGSELARPIPGETSDALGAIAAAHGVWIAAAVLEAVPGGVFDTTVLIDAEGRVQSRQRKSFVYPRFGGADAFQGNLQDARAVDSPWGPIALMNCAETGLVARRLWVAAQEPSVTLVVYANPPANLLANLVPIATESGAPAVGANMLFEPPDFGGQSAFVDAAGTIIWQADSSEQIKTVDMTVVPITRRPRVDAGDVQTIRLPTDRVTLSGYAVADADALSTHWSMESGPASATFGDAASLATTASFSAAGVYVLRLEADDGMQIGEHRVFVNVLPTAGDPSLVGLWAFDGDATDDSGAENHGTLSGNPSYSSDAAPTGQPNSGSLSLNGSDSVVVAHDASLDATDAVTIAAWLKPSVSFPGFVANGGNDWAPIVKKGDTWWEENYWFGFGAYYYFFGRGLGAMLVPSLDDTMLTPNVWCHVAMTIDVPARRAKMFVNGVLDHMVQNVGALATNGDALYIGTKYQGLIDDVRIYSRALADDEIAALVPGAQINMPPVIDAGADEVIAPGDTLQLDGSYGDDAHPATSVISMWQRWDRAAGPGPITFANRFDLATTATFDEPGRYVLELTASDGAHVVRDTREIHVDASAAGAGGAAGAPGNDDGSAGADEDAGCACRLHAHDSGSAPPMLLFAAAVGAMRRRRDLRS